MIRRLTRNDNLKERLAGYRRAREERVGRSWTMFREAMWRNRGKLIEDTDLMGRRVSLMRHALVRGSLPGFRFESILAADDVGMVEHLVTLRAAAPTAAPPGTREKVEILAARAAAGEELWHDEDAAGFDNWDPVTEDETDGEEHAQASAITQG